MIKAMRKLFKIPALTIWALLLVSPMQTYAVLQSIQPIDHSNYPLTHINSSAHTTETHSTHDTSGLILTQGIIMGLILMAGVYNASMFVYNREKALLFYALMQFAMTWLLSIYTKMHAYTQVEFFSEYLSLLGVLGMVSSIFGVLFTREFLSTKRYLPSIDKLMNLTIGVLGIDLIIGIFDRPLLVKYGLLPLLMVPLIYAGYRRYMQGYKPALYYLSGWAVLAVTVMLNVLMVGGGVFSVMSLYVGAAIEAVFFSLALSVKIHIDTEEKEQQKQLLIQQSKLSSMGEMMGNIAHQWRQPLTHLSYTLMNIKEAQKHNELDEIYLDKKVNEANTQLEFMSQTIDDFRDFYAPDKSKEEFSLSDAATEVLEMVSRTFKSNNIKANIVADSNHTIYNFKNEYKQVLLNILSNAKDALLEKDIQNPEIKITINKNTTTICDNAGGIAAGLLDRVFEPYFSTKDGGLGIGLYMSRTIIEHNMGGKLSAENVDSGACFAIVL